MKILLISYFFPPYPRVGAKRVGYWAQAFNESGMKCDVISSIKPLNDTNLNVIHIPNRERGGILAKIIKDPGLNWVVELKEYFSKIKQSDFDYSHVIISGGPFMHFGIGKILKKKFDCKIILDYRDPFADNPRFKDNFFKKKVKLFYEKKFASSADLILTVNKFCGDLIYNKGAKLGIIENGFDDSSISKSESINKASDVMQLMHAGSLYLKRGQTCFLEVIKSKFSNSIHFVQYGPEYEFLKLYKGSGFYSYCGMVDYQELMLKLDEAEACVLITEGDPFESTTKIFDYLALNKKFVIITNGKLKTGNIHEITKNYPNVIWSKNSEPEIEEALIELEKMKITRIDPYPYSRAASFKKLTKLLNGL